MITPYIRQSPPVPRLKTRRNGKQRYIMVNAVVTLYNVQGQANPASERLIHFNSDGVIDFGVFHTGFKVQAVEEEEVRLYCRREFFTETVFQLAVIPRMVWDSVLEFLNDNDLDWRF